MRTTYVQVAEADASGAYPLRLGSVADAQANLVLTEVGRLPSHLAASDRGDLYKALIASGGPDLASVLEGGKGTSIVIDVRPPALNALAWEAMVFEQWHPFLDPALPWSRGRWSASPVEASLLGPLRVLVVVCDPADPLLHAEEELEGIHAAIAHQPGRLHLEIVDAPPNWAHLRTMITDLAPHVVHFIGHTRAQAGGASVLEFADRVNGTTWELNSATIRNAWPSGARLVVISACRSSEPHLQPSSGLVALTDAARAAGVPAVLGMRGDVRSEAAIAFAAGFYGALAQGCPIDQAAAWGRSEAYSQSPEQDDWWFPVLETSIRPSQVLPIRFGVDAAGEQRLSTISEFAMLGRFVDRIEQRRRTWWALDAEGVGQSHHERGAVLVTGPRKGGKSDLVKACLLTYYLRGRTVQYVDLSASSPERYTKDWLGVLRTIRDGVLGCGLCDGLRREMFFRFNARLNWLVTAAPTVEMPDTVIGPVSDAWAKFDHDAGQSQLRIETIFADFLTTLEEAGAHSKLMVALDGVEAALPDSWRDYVVPLLISPLARTRPGLGLILVLPDDAVEDYLLQSERAVMEEVRVDRFEAANVRRLVREFGVRAGLGQAAVAKILGFVADGGPLRPGIFADLEQHLRQMTLVSSS